MVQGKAMKSLLERFYERLAAFEAVVSSNIEAVDYDPETLLLRIKFTNGSIYEYETVPQAIYDGLRQAKSIGSYFHKHIRTHYFYHKVQ